MEDSLNIPFNKLSKIVYSNPDRTPDDLEYHFMTEISKVTGFFIARIHLLEVYKSKHSRVIDCFKFEYDGQNYLLEKGKIKEGN